MRTDIFISVAIAGVLCGCANARPVTTRVDLLGVPGFADSAVLSHQRTILIDADTRWVNVDGGDTVRFVSGAKTFSWSFQTNPAIHVFDLNQVAPPGSLEKRIPVYVAPNPLYGSGG